MNEKIGGLEKSIYGMIRFRQAIDDSDLIDLGYSGSNFMWNNKREGKSNIQERIDRFFASNLWRDNFEYVMVEHLGFHTSDHHPILLNFDKISRQLKCSYSDIRELEKLVEVLIDSEELFWKQCSRVEWLEARDRNSKFFHARATARKKKNYVQRLLNSEGRFEDTVEGMAWVTQEYFQALFKTSFPSPADINVNHCLVGKVLSGKRVNREAFKSLIEQLWSLFGAVETELVGVNTFMFYFNNQVDRDRIWQRGPWYFEKSLIALEKPTGAGNISFLGFNKVELWVQISDVPIMCMNRRTAKWLAEHIGVVIDIPSGSKECWGRYMRVKVQIDILKPLKQWLRLTFDKSDNIVVVGLKYERLPKFCYAYGKIRHGIKECFDIEARTEALEGKLTKFGLWPQF
ncbi:hypothetical protein EZV62_017978 [Acer yangbiense]|uniref:DUF4283 domain-containing protein n=1 Tax=Acer yangbiense TaxID=1000413 RepID=A0A5C7HIT6_9ROSI|nr:hypothetical protein EZV62_017978 [Acer yangbiense]